MKNKVAAGKLGDPTSFSLNSAGYIAVRDNSADNSVYIMNATNNLKQLATTNNIALNNAVYGVSQNQSYP